MKKVKNKRLLSLLTSLTLISSPVLLVVACNHEINRYPAALPNDQQNRILFDFIGVSFNVDAKSQFSSSFKQGMEFIKKQVEGIMAQQEFFNFFVQKLNYDENTANNTFEKIKDNLGLNLLAADYFNTINNNQNFDSKVYASKLIFQTENWHLHGTTKFNYNNNKFYSDPLNNPDTIFTSSYLYSDLYNEKRDDKIQEVAKYADKHYNEIISELTEGKSVWASPDTPIQLPPSLGEGENAIQDYQKKLERFKWWLRFRYQQYYNSTILPQLNETLFTMANILDSILKISPAKTINDKPKIQIENSKYAIQLQDWGPNSAWSSKYRFIWDYTTSVKNAIEIDRQWNQEPLPDLINKEATGLNPAFLNKLASSDRTLKNTVDPILGINAFINDSSAKSYDKSVKSNNISGWANNSDGFHYWGKDTKGSFAYSAPIYWIDVVQNLNFNFYNKANDPIVVGNDDYKGLISTWNNAENSPISNSNFSKYIRGVNMPSINDRGYIYYQEMKWNIFWQMIYFLASQADTNSNKDIAKNNFTTAAKALFPKYIKKEKIYNEDFWNAVSSYY